MSSLISGTSTEQSKPSLFSIFIWAMVIVISVITIYIFYSMRQGRGNAAIIVPVETEVWVDGRRQSPYQFFGADRTVELWVYQFHAPAGRHPVTIIEPDGTEHAFEIMMESKRRVDAYQFIDGRLEPY
ncbi:MAG: hypothetical protein D6675_08435 [Gemmatimonadetes bacterium]|nr:MAG: hypothetical protein D6675_08435 [Gemmatimonadota bacterium]